MSIDGVLSEQEAPMELNKMKLTSVLSVHPKLSHQHVISLRHWQTCAVWGSNLQPTGQPNYIGDCFVPAKDTLGNPMAEKTFVLTKNVKLENAIKLRMNVHLTPSGSHIYR